MSKSKTVQRWSKTSVQGLVRHSSGTYYARLQVGGKDKWKSLKTPVLEVAKNKLRDEQKATAGETVKEARSGRMTMGNAIATLEAEIDSGAPLRARRKRHNQESSRDYRRETLAALKRSWQAVNGAELAAQEVRKITKEDAEKWGKVYRDEVSPSRFNNTLGTLRRLFAIAIAAGEAYRDPAAGIERAEVKAKKLTLPERQAFPQFVRVIRESGHRTADDSADLVELLAYTGGRIEEACFVTWGDVDFMRGTVRFTKTKNGDERAVPMIEEARALLEKMRAARAGEDLTEPVLRVGEARGSMTAAAKKIGMKRITHHDLRHLFATVAIESGVDIPTVSRWLGHKDGGALALRTYGHLRDEHSQSQAKRVSFAPVVEPGNVLAFGKAGVA
jgi:integrase